MAGDFSGSLFKRQGRKRELERSNARFSSPGKGLRLRARRAFADEKKIQTPAMTAGCPLSEERDGEGVAFISQTDGGSEGQVLTWRTLPLSRYPAHLRYVDFSKDLIP
ncbi:hypothetical protein AAFF_G00038040 [Aldrovandia affinis]|uniref:Uncharacterized protein n=1 Tax=Aldrovandia affinis TaxID=143900 RepID=A0AAD7T529_9TELE|nr:hypothetical protein AAFF_G00038040 [Aldrovandia affinis]